MRFCRSVHDFWYECTAILRKWTAAAQHSHQHLASTGGVAGADKSTPVGEPDTAAKVTIARTCLAETLRLMREVNLPVPSSALQWLYPGSPLLVPRKGYRPPDATLELRIPHSAFERLRLEVQPFQPTHQAYPELFDATQVTVRRDASADARAVRTKIQLNAFGMPGPTPGRHQLCMGWLVRFRSGLPEEQPLVTRMRGTLRRAGGPSPPICVDAEFSKQRPWIAYEMASWEDLSENKDAFFPGGILTFEVAIWFPDCDPRD